MNIEGILSLLKVMDLAKQWPQFKGIHDIAQAQLVEANHGALAELKTIEDKKAAAKAEADAKAAAEAKAKAEEEKAKAEAATQSQNKVEAQQRAEAVAVDSRRGE